MGGGGDFSSCMNFLGSYFPCMNSFVVEISWTIFFLLCKSLEDHCINVFAGLLAVHKLNFFCAIFPCMNCFGTLPSP